MSRTRISRAFAALAGLVFMAAIAAPARGADPSPDLWERLKAFHGDLCLGSVMGARIGLAAKAALLKAGGEGKLMAAYYDLSCPVDGIQVAVGTTYGGRTLTVEDRDDHRLVLTAEGNGKQVEAKLTKLADDKGAAFRVMKGKSRALPEGSKERQDIEKEMAVIVKWFQTAPDAEVVEVKIVH
ncbi:MAG: FmdE family protein [Deltaproteobacteria bacterium]|nr:FmdE family protein [Deltaproteobacteria bacterium]